MHLCALTSVCLGLGGCLPFLSGSILLGSRERELRTDGSFCNELCDSGHSESHHACCLSQIGVGHMQPQPMKQFYRIAFCNFVKVLYAVRMAALVWKTVSPNRDGPDGDGWSSRRVSIFANRGKKHIRRISHGARFWMDFACSRVSVAFRSRPDLGCMCRSWCCSALCTGHRIHRAILPRRLHSIAGCMFVVVGVVFVVCIVIEKHVRCMA